LPVAERPAPKRGTRLDEDWRPSEETRDWTLERLSSQDAATELEKFRNHWISKTGRDATKLDWDRTWRNWVLNSRASTSPQQSLPGVGRATAKAQGWLALAQDPEGRLA
jgi:outer membrane protease